ncbi:hypothetical protein Q3G72_001170 [Acer saccharum]|nr:hypothetical protein Q3G72_001170 [Acer saccharum]
MSVTVPQSTVDKAFDDAMRKVGKKASLPGYRPGKIPKGLLERNFGGQVQAEVEQKLVEDTLFAAMDQNDVQAVAMPKVTSSHLHRGAPFVYTVEVEVRPEITLATYKGLESTAPDTSLSESEVQEHFDSLRKEHAQTVPVTDRSVVQKGDFVLLDYLGTLDGVPFDGGKADNALVEVGAADYIPGFAEGIEGAEVPGQKDVEVTFPADYGVAQLAGQKAIFAMTFKELKMRQMPALDDDFAKDIGHDSLAALTESTRKELSERKAEQAKGAQRRQVLEALIAANPFEVPPTMVDNQVERLVESARARVERMTGQKFNLDSQMLAELRGSNRQDAEFQVRSGLLLMEVAKAADIKIEAADIDAEIERICAEAGEQANLARNFYSANERRDELSYRLLEDRAVALLLEHATPKASA